MPLCKEDCHDWWEDCKNEYTCMTNWHKGWDWSSGKHTRTQTSGYIQTNVFVCSHRRQIHTFAYTFTDKTNTHAYVHTVSCTHSHINAHRSSITGIFFLFSGMNKCPAGSKCRKWTDVYPTPQAMCEQIWSNSYLYTTHSKTSGRCMQIWFNGTNPNKKVAEYYLNNAQQHQSFAMTTLLFLAFASFSVMM